MTTRNPRPRQGFLSRGAFHTLIPAICSCSVLGVPAQRAAAQSQFRAVWADAFHDGFKSIAQIDTMVGEAVTGNYNVIIAEVIAFHDQTGGAHGAYWNSSIVPKATDISGGIDPLAELCTRAHAQGIEVHCWLIPFRVSSAWPPSGNATLAAHPEWLMVSEANMGGGPAILGSYYTLDPGSPGVQSYLLDIVRELVTNYETDGIHWDRIRYDDGVGDNGGYPADASYEFSSLKRFQRITGFVGTPAPSTASWRDFRRRTVGELVRRTRAEVAAVKTNPRQPLRHSAALICYGNAPSSCSGFTSTSAWAVFQDWRLWLENGWLDAGIIMNYKRDHCPPQDAWYRNWVDRALTCWQYDREIYIGQANYLNSMANSVTQLDYALSAGSKGVTNYSYWATRLSGTECNSSWVSDFSWYDYVAANLFTGTAPTPNMPWKDPATATEGTLWGRVLDAATGDPVDDATVQVAGQPAVQTDGAGYYVVTLVPAAAAGTNHAVSVSATGLPGANQPAARILAGDVVRYDFALGAAPATIALSTASLNRNIIEGGTLPDDGFTVTNVGAAPLNYYVTSDAAWASVTPVNGVNTGALDALTIEYDVSGLSEGNHTASIDVNDAAATNSPQTLTVFLTVGDPPIPGDLDADGDVDLADHGLFQACQSGVAIPAPPGCDAAKLDADNDVDSNDIALFLGCMSGADVPGDPNCLNGN